VLRLAWPLVLGNSLWTAQIVYDRVLLARSGSALVGAGMSAALLLRRPHRRRYGTASGWRPTGSGEGRPDEGERATRAGLVVVLTFTLVVGLLSALARGVLAEMFRPQGEDARWGEVRAHVPRLLGFVAVYRLFDGVNRTFSSALRGAGDTRFVTGVALLLSWPVMGLLAWRWGWGLSRAGASPASISSCWRSRSCCASSGDGGAPCG
jgi:Na+-driven multidrug efflux pump